MSKKISLHSFLSEEKFQWLMVILCQLVFIGFVSSRALVSIGMISLLASSLLFNGFAETFKKYFQRKELLVLSVFFWLVLLSGIYSDDKGDWLNWVRIKLPFIALPLAFAAIRKLEHKKFVALLYGFILTFFASTVVVLVRYFLNFQEVTEAFRMGQSIAMPFSHIRYTLMVAFSFFCVWYLIENKLFLFSENEKWLQYFLMGFAFVALHILSVRSGLLALYLGILFLLARFVWQKKNLVVAMSAVLFFIATSYTAYQLLPGLQNKIAYMKYDVAGLKWGDINYHYDAMRIVSMKTAWNVWQQNKVLGVGAGDLKTEMGNAYQKLFPDLKEENRLMPHNQLMWVLASLGAVGLVLFLFAFFFPLLINKNYQQWPLVVLCIIIFSSFFTEATLEEQMGTGFYLLLLLVLLNQKEVDTNCTN